MSKVSKGAAHLKYNSENFIPDCEETLLNLKKNNKLLELNEKIVYASQCLEPSRLRKQPADWSSHGFEEGKVIVTGAEGLLE